MESGHFGEIVRNYPERLMRVEEFTYTVTIAAGSRSLADQVMAERIGHDEDYGFDYTIGYQ